MPKLGHQSYIKFIDTKRLSTNAPHAWYAGPDGRLYAADGNIDLKAFDEPLLSFRGDGLHCTGLIVDNVNTVLDNAPDIPAGLGLGFHYWKNRLEQMYHARGSGIYDDPDRATSAMMYGDSVGAWPPVATSGYDSGQCLNNERYACLPTQFRHVQPYARSYDRTGAMSVVDTVLRDPRPFFKEGEYIGLGPAYINQDTDKNNRTWDSAGWLLAIVAGCSVSLLLCEIDDATHELIGTCFVQGWMDGE